MGEENDDMVHIWDGPNLKATLFGLSLGLAQKRTTLTGVHIWDGPNPNAALLEL